LHRVDDEDAFDIVPIVVYTMRFV